MSSGVLEAYSNTPVSISRSLYRQKVYSHIMGICIQRMNTPEAWKVEHAHSQTLSFCEEPCWDLARDSLWGQVRNYVRSRTGAFPSHLFLINSFVSDIQVADHVKLATSTCK